ASPTGSPSASVTNAVMSCLVAPSAGTDWEAGSTPTFVAPPNWSTVVVPVAGGEVDVAVTRSMCAVFDAFIVTLQAPLALVVHVGGTSTTPPSAAPLLALFAAKLMDALLTPGSVTLIVVVATPLADMA